jgi:hypothetical protein
MGLFMDDIVKAAKFGPGPAEYTIDKKWDKSILGTMKGGKKITFLDIVQKAEKVRPGPFSYSPEKPKKKIEGGKLEKQDRPPFIASAEYFSMQSPAASLPDV